MVLRDYQLDGVTKIREQFSLGRQRVLYVLPTGGGKTHIIASEVQKATNLRQRVYIMVHRPELEDQAAEKLNLLGVEYGVIRAGHPSIDHLAQIVSVQTAIRRYESLPRPDFVVIDEAHRAVSPSYRTLLEYWQAPTLGVSATPARTDGRGLGVAFDSLVLGPTVKELMDRGFLADYRCVLPPSKVTADGLATVAGDFDKRQAGERVDRPEIIGDAVQHYLKYAPGKQILLFCANVQHAHNVAAQFNLAGIPTIALDGNTDKNSRREVIARYKAKELLGLASCDLLNEGLDCDAEVASLLRLTKSLIVHRQQLGRILRPKQDGSKALILDHVGNIMRNGLPDEDYPWSLEGIPATTRSGLRIPRVVRCGSCYLAFAPARYCPECGTEVESKNREIKQQDGELREFTREQIKQARAFEQTQAKTREQLIELGLKRNMKFPAMWADHVLRNRKRSKGN